MKTTSMQKQVSGQMHPVLSIDMVTPFVKPTSHSDRHSETDNMADNSQSSPV